MDIYELYTWQSPNGRPSLSKFDFEPPIPHHPTITGYALYRITYHQTGYHVQMIAQWNRPDPGPQPLSPLRPTAA